MGSWTTDMAHGRRAMAVVVVAAERRAMLAGRRGLGVV